MRSKWVPILMLMISPLMMGLTSKSVDITREGHPDLKAGGTETPGTSGLLDSIPVIGTYAGGTVTPGTSGIPERIPGKEKDSKPHPSLLTPTTGIGFGIGGEKGWGFGNNPSAITK